MSDAELKKKNKGGEWEELCTSCISKSYNHFTIFDFSWAKDETMDIVGGIGSIGTQEIIE